MKPVEKKPGRIRWGRSARRLAIVVILLLVGCNQGANPANQPNPVSPKTDKAFEGALDLVNSQVVAGWAWDQNHPDHTIQVDVFDGNKKIANIPADLFRQDLAAAKKGTGKYGFSFDIPDSLKDGKPHTIRVTIAESNVDLEGSPKEIALNPSESPDSAKD
jgi:hypothetical protein